VEEWANEIEPDMSDWEAAVTARNADLDAEAEEEALWAERRREERRAVCRRVGALYETCTGWIYLWLVPVLVGLVWQGSWGPALIVVLGLGVDVLLVSWLYPHATRLLAGMPSAPVREAAERAELRREERRARVQRLLQGLERWAGLLILAAMGAAAAEMFGQGHWKAGSLGLLFLLALIACYRRWQRMLQRERDQALAASLPADMRACRVEQQGDDLVFRDLETEALLWPLRMGDISYLADPETMPQYRNRRPSDDEERRDS